MSSEALLSLVYATDEDIAVRAYGDFAALVPKDAILAQGTDGVFSSGDLWTLNSASNNFATQGIKVSHVVQLSGPAPYKGSGRLFAVGAVNGDAITLRVIGKADGIGSPPSPAGGLTGVSFVIRTFDPQLEDASFQINQQFGIDPNWPQAAPTLIYDLRVLRQTAALTVLVRAYTTDTRSKDGDFARKIGELKQALSDTKAILQIRWNQATNIPPPTSLYSTRIVR
jgi:hypothetical protein